jgi:ribonuclease BN (tRNA processing enzyme)
VRALAAAMGHPISDDLGFELHFSELPPGADHDLGVAHIRSFETNHQPEAHPHGYRIDLGGRKLSYSGDTGWFAGLPAHVNGSDLFISECTQHRRNLDFHLSYEELVAHRDEFDCGKMVLTHLGHEMSDRRGSCDFETADDGLALKL